MLLPCLLCQLQWKECMTANSEIWLLFRILGFSRSIIFSTGYYEQFIIFAMNIAELSNIKDVIRLKAPFAHREHKRDFVGPAGTHSEKINKTI